MCATSMATKTLAVAGGMKKITDVKPSDPKIDISLLWANCEKADTHLVLHSIG